MQKGQRTMGMSASQARLLSITSRLTNNEFRSQTITNSKLRLAEKSSEASQEYMDALNTQQLMFGVYGDDGSYKAVSLTPTLLYQYADLKNQYSLVNNSGKVMVSAKDAENFEKSNSLYEFLACYGLVEENSEIGTPMYDLLVHKGYGDLAKIFEDNVMAKDADSYKNGCTDRLYGINDASCFVHILAHLLDYDGRLDNKALVSNGEYTTSTGVSFSFNGTDGNSKNIIEDSAMFWNNKDYSDNLKTISDALREYPDVFMCNGDDNRNTPGKQNNLKEIIERDDTPSDIDKLVSDYIYNKGDGSYTLKTIRQKLVDMIYLGLSSQETFGVEQSDSTESIKDEQLRNSMEEFIEDLRYSLESINKVEVLPDSSKAQWYVNLWYQMNGSDTANLVRDEEYNGVSYKYIDNMQKTGANFAILEDNLLSSSDWLQFALEHGMVTMYQAQYNNPAQDSGKVSELTSEGVTWTSIIYTNASDITQQDDETAIAIAEVKYKNAVTEIEKEDKKFDQDLKKLDTEHAALQTEYDSIKEVISKNTERSFKAFS